MTDFVEADCVTAWLLLAKLGNLVGLFYLRAHIMKTYYPESRIL